MRFSFFKIINSFAERWKCLDLTAIFFARTVPYLMVLALVLFSYLTKNTAIIFFTLTSAFISRFVITQAIYFIYKKKRPGEKDGAKLLIPLPRNPSFPSGHASFFFGLSLPVLLYNIPLGLALIIATCLNGVARVFCGVHWSSDILAGFVTGLISFLVVYYLRIFI